MVLDGIIGLAPISKRHGHYTEVRSVIVPTDSVKLHGDLTIPKNAEGIVLFAHGSGSSRHSTRNKHVAQVLQKAGLATLLIDLLTEDEEKIDDYTMHLRFDIELLAKRLAGATSWLTKNPDTKNLNVGYFGASTGAAAALVASVDCQNLIKAIVSRGGRPDLAGSVLPRVKAPTLLIVGGNDSPVIEMNEEALNLLTTEKKIVIIPDATHLFEEPGTLDEVARLAADWFVKHLTKTKNSIKSKKETAVGVS
ncbi:MAG TPA: dienelactone hydrolase family protein [Nitrosopumilaceae archaeon]|nr:dienelactone hydrolase family protein [Nitrosopumilaceae archaeon]